MARELRIQLVNQPVGREETPHLDPYRVRFAAAAKEASARLKDTPLRGEARVRRFNGIIKEILEGR